MSKMIHFLRDMAVNPNMQDMFWKNPTSVVASRGLLETVALSDQNNRAVTGTIMPELTVHELANIQGSAGFFDPGPDTLPDPPPPPSSDEKNF